MCAFDDCKRAEVLRVRARGNQADRPAVRVGDHSRRCPNGLDDADDVECVVRQAVAAAQHPTRIAVAAKVGSDDVVVGAQLFGEAAPQSCVVAAAVDEDKRRRALVAPVPI